MPNGNFYTTGEINFRFNQKGQLIQKVSTGRDYPRSYLWREQYADQKQFLAGQPEHRATSYFTLDEKGRLVRGRLYQSQRTYSYDQQGRLIRVVQLDDSGEIRQKELTYENGNVVKVLASGPTYEQVLTYTYDLGRSCLLAISFDPANELSLDRDQDVQNSRNLVLTKTDVRTYHSAGNLTTQVLNDFWYTYVFDAQNRVRRRRLVQTYRSNPVQYPTQLLTAAFASLVDVAYSCP